MQAGKIVRGLLSIALQQGSDAAWNIERSLGIFRLGRIPVMRDVVKQYVGDGRGLVVQSRDTKSQLLCRASTSISDGN